MSRAKYQVLVIPYCVQDSTIRYCIFHRSDMDAWQFIAGGGEDEDKSILISAKREAFEEANIEMNKHFIQLDTQSSIPTKCFKGAIKIWGAECLIIPEYSFAVNIDMDNINLKISNEHTEYDWVKYEVAIEKLKYDSNKTALWELDTKIKRGLLSNNI